MYDILLFVFVHLPRAICCSVPTRRRKAVYFHFRFSLPCFFFVVPWHFPGFFGCGVLLNVVILLRRKSAPVDDVIVCEKWKKRETGMPRKGASLGRPPSPITSCCVRAKDEHFNPHTSTSAHVDVFPPIIFAHVRRVSPSISSLMCTFLGSR